PVDLVAMLIVAAPLSKGPEGARRSADSADQAETLACERKGSVSGFRNHDPRTRQLPVRVVSSTAVRSPRDTPEITLVGAGLAGSLLAIFLARRGHRVTFLERRPDPRKTVAAPSAGRSINLALANRGIAALEEVGVMEDVRPELIPMAGRMLHD